MMLRAAALSLLVLFSIMTLLPLAHSSAEGEGGRVAATYRKKRIRRHSRAWWRRYRAHLRRKRAALRRELEKPSAPENSRADAATISPSAFYATGGTYNDPRGAFSLTMPIGWSNRPTAAGGELKFRVYAPDGRAVGQAALSVIQVPASKGGALSARAKARTLGGVSFADLNRTVIDKMIAANGWVINDLVREINGRRVFIVLAQTAASPDASVPQQSWTFYFTEIDGRIYSLAASASLEFSDRMAQESEQVIASFQLRPSSNLAEKTPTR